MIVPPQGRDVVLQELHEGHPGMTKMKSLARMYVWWPNLEKDVERSVQLCHHCQEQQSAPPVALLQPWKWPSRPWARLHMDFAGPVNGKMILIVIDTHSRWIEAYPTKTATSSAVIELSRVLFSQFGIPEVLVTDNGPCFVSEEFEIFLVKNGIKHITSALYHPATNGLAERSANCQTWTKERNSGCHENATRQDSHGLSINTTEHYRHIPSSAVTGETHSNTIGLVSP